MTNAKEELFEALHDAEQSINTIDYGYIRLRDNRMEFDGNIRSHQLALLDKEYDDGYGGQELSGTIVFKDGTWLSRGEYDGSEWWDYNTMPGRDQVFQADIDKRNIKQYKAEIIKYTDHPTLSYLADNYKKMLLALEDELS